MTRAPQRPSRGRRLRWFKPGVTLLCVATAGIYLTGLWLQGRAGRLEGGGVFTRTGDYLWAGFFSARLVLEWLASLAAVLFFCEAWPRALTPRRPLARALAAAAVLGLAGLLSYMQWLNFPAAPPAIVLPFAALGLLAAYYGVLRAPDGPPPLARLGDGLSRLTGWRLYLPVMALCTGLFIYACHAIFYGQPIVTDSQSQIAQARLMLSGHFTLAIPQALRDVVAFPYAVHSVPSYSQYPPGHILLLMPVLAAGLPAQALNILAGVLTAGVAMALARRLEGPAVALATGLLLAASPMTLMMSGCAMNHATTALALIVAAWGLMPPPEGAPPLPARRAWWMALAGGFALGWAVITRPLTGAAHALIWGVAWLAMMHAALRGRGVASPRELLGRMLAVLAGLTPPAAILLFYNARTTGHPLTMGYKISNPALHQLGFHAEGALRYLPIDAINNIAADLISLDGLLFGLAVGYGWLMLAWWLRTRLRRHELIVAGLIVSQFVFYKLYQFHDLFLGPRFLYEAVPLLALLAAAGMGRVLRGGGLRAGIALLALALLLPGAWSAGLQFWQGRFVVVAARHQRLERFVEGLRPLERPTVVILPAGDGEMVGRWFMGWRADAPLWFVEAPNLEQARRQPALRGCEWVRYQDRLMPPP